MNQRAKLAAILWLAGAVGVVSTLWIDLTPLLDRLAEAEGAELPPMTIGLRLLSLIQPLVLLTGAVLAGVFLAERVGLRSPWAEALATGGDHWTALKPQLGPGLVGGLLGGAAIVVVSAAWLPLLPSEFTDAADSLSLPAATRFLYGGITEEILMRWGLMTLLVWVAHRVAARKAATPPAAAYVFAIVISALLFGAGHLGLAALLAPELTASIIGYIVIANALFALVAGYLYWRFGLEAAIIAHMMAHVVLMASSAVVG